MVDLGDIIKQLRKKYPKCRIVSCADYGEFYDFYLPTKRWDGNPWEAPAWSVEIRKSDGAEIGHDSTELLDMKWTPVDLTPFLTDEEIAFIKKVKILEEEAMSAAQ